MVLTGASFMCLVRAQSPRLLIWAAWRCASLWSAGGCCQQPRVYLHLSLPVHACSCVSQQGGQPHRCARCCFRLAVAAAAGRGGGCLGIRGPLCLGPSRLNGGDVADRKVRGVQCFEEPGGWWLLLNASNKVDVGPGGASGVFLLCRQARRMCSSSPEQCGCIEQPVWGADGMMRDGRDVRGVRSQVHRQRQHGWEGVASSRLMPGTGVFGGMAACGGMHLVRTGLRGVRHACGPLLAACVWCVHAVCWVLAPVVPCPLLASG
mmetsp:Transcript_7772/g.19293  ORF Transcript_7772/g.19293 Transcript_7772/m.19293 type:complete len:263 (-) Transcript_7772:1093-1881(-)